VATRDWLEWHQPYDDPSSPLAQRLLLVQHHLRTALDLCPDGTITVVSMCAGQGRDLLGVLAEHPRRSDVRARLVELDERNVEIARQASARLDLADIEVVEGDAGTSDIYEGFVPADIILACGVFGNVTDKDIERTVTTLPSLCAAGATVIWTRHRGSPDLTPTIRGWFEQASFIEERFDGPENLFIGVGMNRLIGDPEPFEAGQRLFDFVGYDVLGVPGQR
jgi:hypothetical protein